MTIIDAIRTLRKERDIGFHEAVVLAVEHFLKTNRPVPESMLGMYRRFKA